MNQDGRATFVPVTAGIIGGLDVEVTGIAPGSRVIVGPFQLLRELKDGTKVAPTGSSRSRLTPRQST